MVKLGVGPDVQLPDVNPGMAQNTDPSLQGLGTHSSSQCPAWCSMPHPTPQTPLWSPSLTPQCLHTGLGRNAQGRGPLCILGGKSVVPLASLWNGYLLICRCKNKSWGKKVGALGQGQLKSFPPAPTHWTPSPGLECGLFPLGLDRKPALSSPSNTHIPNS